MMEFIEAMFSCKSCGLNRVKVRVSSRLDGENIIEFTNRVADECGKMHEIRSPLCPSRKLDVYLPVTGNGIGLTGRELTAEEKVELKQQVDAISKEQKE